MTTQLKAHGIVLFGHGARDPRWAEPFERLASLLASRRHSTLYEGPVELAYLELMTPDLPTAIAKLAGAGCETVTVIPIFFGSGGHLRRDLPALVEQSRAAHPGLTIRSAGVVGEDDAVLDAIAEFCLRQIVEMPAEFRR